MLDAVEQVRGVDVQEACAYGGDDFVVMRCRVVEFDTNGVAAVEEV